MIRFLIENEQNKVNLTDEMISCVKKVCNKVLEYEDCDFNAEISITFVDDEQIKQINYEYRKIDKPTDVLSFPILEFDDDGNIINSEYDEDLESDYIVMGDIVISLERAQKQAHEFEHSLIREVGFLTVHSMLHLLGYDHVNDEEGEKIMNFKQNEILNSLNITRD